MTAGMLWNAFQALFKVCGIYLTLKDTWIWKQCLLPCFQTHLIFIVSACCHDEFYGTLAWWVACSEAQEGPREAVYSHGTGCSALMERFMPHLLKTCSWCYFWPQDSLWFRIPKKGEFPQRKNENTHGCRSFQTDSGKKKSLFTMEGLLVVLSNPSDISFFHQQLQSAWQKCLLHND